MNFYRFKMQDLVGALFDEAIELFKRKKKTGPTKTYVIMLHYINGDPPREFGRTEDPLEAAHMAIQAMGDKDPFIGDVTTREELH